MGAVVALALRLAGLGAGALGVSLPVFALVAGLALGSGPAGYAGYRIGHALGWTGGAASADQTAQINTLARDLAEARADTANARTSAEDARATSQRDAASTARAHKERDSYAHALAKRGPVGAYPMSDDDMRRMLRNSWAVQPGGRPARPTARR